MGLLIDLIPAHARKWLYAVLSAALFVYAIVEAAGEDWKSAIVSVLTALVTTLATANTDVDLEAVDVDEDDLPDDDYPEGYEAAILNDDIVAEPLNWDDLPPAETPNPRGEAGAFSLGAALGCVLVAVLLLAFIDALGWI